MNKRELLVDLYKQLKQQIALYIKEHLIDFVDDEQFINYWTDLEFNNNIQLKVRRTQRNEYVETPMSIYCIDNEIVTDLGHKVFDAELDSLSEYDIRQKNDISYDSLVDSLELNSKHLFSLIIDNPKIQLNLTHLNIVELWACYLRLYYTYSSLS